MKKEYVYTVLIKGVSWAGNYGDASAVKAGAAIQGRLTGGALEANSEEEARAEIITRHEIWETRYTPDGNGGVITERVKTGEPVIRTLEARLAFLTLEDL